jgi:chromosome partitioning protein
MILAFVGQKGGSGKTTAALAVASELSARNRRVLVADADPQGSCRTWAAVAAEAGLEVPTVAAAGPDLHLRLPSLAAAYDATILDCPPRSAPVQRAALMVADLAVVPCGPAAVDAWALAETLELVEAARAVRPELRAAVLLTRMSRTALGRGAREALAGCGVPLLSAELGSRVAYQEAPAAGMGPAQYAPRTPAAAEVRALTDELLSLLTAARRRSR